MDVHENARTTPHSRLLMVQRLNAGWSVSAVAAAYGVCPRTVRKWRDRFRSEGESGVRDRSCRPHASPRRLSEALVQRIEELRRMRLSGPAIARRMGCAVSSVGITLCRLGLGRLSSLDPKPEIIRYQRERPGELIHIDIKKLGRIDGVGHRITGDRRGHGNKRHKGWEFVHVAVDDASRLAYTELLADERKESAIGFTARAIAWFERHGAKTERVMTDNGSAYNSHAFRDLLAGLGIKHKRTRPYTPRTNGKAERFIQTSLREWAYAQPFQTSADRAGAMPDWIAAYNRDRPHSGIGGISPMAWIDEHLKAASSTPRDTSDPQPGFVGADGVKPREATAKGGSGLTPTDTTQAQSQGGGDNVFGNDS